MFPEIALLKWEWGIQEKALWKTPFVLCWFLSRRSWQNQGRSVQLLVNLAFLQLGAAPCYKQSTAPAVNVAYFSYFLSICAQHQPHSVVWQIKKNLQLNGCGSNVEKQMIVTVTHNLNIQQLHYRTIATINTSNWQIYK